MTPLAGFAPRAARRALVAAAAAVLAAPLAHGWSTGRAGNSGNPDHNSGGTCAQSSCHESPLSPPYDYTAALVSLPEASVIATGVLSAPFELRVAQQAGDAAEEIGFAISADSGLALSLGTLDSSDDQAQVRDDATFANAFTHGAMTTPFTVGDGETARDLIRLRMQADVAGTYTIYYAVNLANDANAAAGDTIVVGTAEITARAAPTATTDTLALSEPASESEFALNLVAAGSALEYTVFSALRADGVSALQSGVALSPGIGARASGALTLTVPANYNHATALVFQVHDGTLDSNRATYTVDIAPVADAPTLEAASVELSEDAMASFTLVARDPDLDPALSRDAAAETMTVTLARAPASGQLLASGGDALSAGDALDPLLVGADGREVHLVYRPAPDFHGADSFAWRAEDAAGLSASTEVAISVAAVDDRPVAAELAATVRQGPNSVELAFSASDVDGYASDPASTLRYRIASTPDCGALSALDTDAALAVGGTVDAGVRFHYDGGPAAGQACTGTGPRSFTYQAFHADADPADCAADPAPTACSLPADVAISVTMNNPPVALAGTLSVVEDGAITFAVTGTDLESAPGTLSLDESSLAVSTGTFMVVGAARVVDGAFVQSVAYDPPANFNGAVTFSYQVLDSDSARSEFAAVTITVTPLNDPPQPRPPESLVTAEDTALDFSLDAVDVDAVPELNMHPDAGAVQGASIIYEIVSTTAAAGQLFSVVRGAEQPVAPLPFDTVASTLRYRPLANFNGSYALRWRARDDAGGADSSSALVDTAIEVTPVNDAPVADSAERSTDEDVALRLALPVSDVEGTSEFAYRFSALPEGHAILFGPAATQRCGGAPCYAPARDFHGLLELEYSVQERDDPAAVSSSAQLAIEVNPVNDAPVFTVRASDDNRMSLVGNTPGSFAAVDAETFDATDVDGDVLTYTIASWETTAATLVSAAALDVGDGFTQRAVDAGRVLLELLVPLDRQVETTVRFDVSDGTVSGTMERTVLLVAGNSPPELRVPDSGAMRFALAEGAELTFFEPAAGESADGALRAEDATDPDVTFTVMTDVGEHAGHLYLREKRAALADCAPTDAGALLERGDDFVQSDVRRRCVVYRHSGAEAGAVSIALEISDFFGASPSGTLLVDPDIVPVNDAPTRTATGELALTLSQGATLGVGSATLAYRDDDDPASVLVYEIVGFPERGDLRLDAGDGPEPLLAGSLFTQSDVDAGRLSYRHDGELAGDDSFEYELCDSGGNLRLGQDPIAGRNCVRERVALTIVADAQNRLTLRDDRVDAHEYLAQDDTEIVAAVLANDEASDAEFFELSIVAVAGAAPGARVSTATRAVGGVSQAVILYTPPRPAAAMRDTVRYTARSPAGVEAAAILTVEIALAEDADADGLADLWELRYGLDPTTADSDGDGQADGDEDLDADGVANLGEYRSLDYPPEDPGLAIQWASVPDVSTNAISVMTPISARYLTRPVACRSAILNACPLGAEPVSSLEPLLPSGGLLRSGVHRVTWRATARYGARVHASTRAQTVRVYPMLEFGPGRVLAEGSSVPATIHLSGPAPDYPVTLRVSLSGDATFGEDYSLSPSTDALSFQAGQTEISLVLNVHDDMIPEREERIVVSLLSASNATLSDARRYTAVVLEGNQPPTARLRLFQRVERDPDAELEPAELELGNVIFNDLGVVTARALISDPNADDVHQLRWRTETPGRFGIVDLATMRADEVRFDPQGLGQDATPSGGGFALTGALRHIGVTVTDDSGQSVSTSRWFSVLNSAEYRAFDRGQPADPTRDADANGIPDGLDRIADPDGDGIPAFSDDPSLPEHAIPVSSDRSDIVVADAGLSIAMGRTALSTSLLRGVYGVGASRGALTQLVSLGGAEAELAADGDRLATNFLYDFVVSGLRPGAVASVVIPLSVSALIRDTRYRKYQTGSGWVDFVDDGDPDGPDGALFTAPGNGAGCPAPSSLQYRPGLNLSDRCLRISIRDGGANDDDGAANGVVVDPGGVVVSIAAVSEPDSGGPNVVASSGAFAPWLAACLLALACAPRARRRRVAG